MESAERKAPSEGEGSFTTKIQRGVAATKGELLRIHHEDTENDCATAESNRIRGGRECDSGLSSVNSVVAPAPIPISGW